jgi:hypothetical protein
MNQARAQATIDHATNGTIHWRRSTIIDDESLPPLREIELERDPELTLKEKQS